MSSQSDIDELRDELKRVNEKITSNTATIEAFQRDFETKFEVLASSVEAMSIIRYYASRTDDMTSDELEGGVISCLKRLEEFRCSAQQADNLPQAHLKEMVQEKQRFIFGALLDLAKRKKIPPGEVLTKLKESLGPEGTAATVDIDEVNRVFGSAEAVNWKELM